MDHGAIGKAIKNARELKNWTQDDLAKFLGVNKSTVSRWEKGQGLEGRVEEIEAALEVDLSESAVSPKWHNGDALEARLIAVASADWTLLARACELLQEY